MPAFVARLLAAKSRGAKAEKEAKVDLRNEDSEDDNDAATCGIRAMSIKLPPFSESNPELWFSKAESQFLVKGITSDTTKFHHLYTLMTDKAANKIKALLLCGRNADEAGPTVWQVPVRQGHRAPQYQVHRGLDPLEVGNNGKLSLIHI